MARGKTSRRRPIVLEVDRRGFLRVASAASAAAVLAACTPFRGTQTTLSRSRSSVPEPTNAMVTRWRQDPFAMGSYSYLSTWNTDRDRELLAAPIGNRLFFAGEATSMSNPATVHGALISGRDAAAQIMAIPDLRSSVAVIGAGAAGLAAAADLVEAGNSVVVYEARSRIGGRVSTDTSLGVPVDLGASWIQGIRGNPLTAIADELDYERLPTDYESMVVYDKNGSRVPDSIWNGPVRTVNGAARRGITIAEAIENATKEMTQRQLERFDFVVVSTFEHEYAADAVDLASAAPHEGDYFRGGDVTMPEGYIGLLAGLTDGLDIRLGTAIDTVAVTDTGVTLHSGQGSWTHDRCVVTLPLGVLKEGAVRFEPPLPRPKLDAIDRFGMGLLDKVILEFPEVFWNNRYQWFGYVGEKRGAWAQWFDLTPTSGRPMLVGFHAGTAAEDLAALTDDEVVDQAMRMLRSVF